MMKTLELKIKKRKIFSIMLGFGFGFISIFLNLESLSLKLKIKKKILLATGFLLYAISGFFFYFLKFKTEKKPIRVKKRKEESDKKDNPSVTMSYSKTSFFPEPKDKYYRDSIFSSLTLLTGSFLPNYIFYYFVDSKETKEFIGEFQGGFLMIYGILSGFVPPLVLYCSHIPINFLAIYWRFCQENYKDIIFSLSMSTAMTQIFLLYLRLRRNYPESTGLYSLSFLTSLSSLVYYIATEEKNIFDLKKNDKFWLILLSISLVFCICFIAINIGLKKTSYFQINELDENIFGDLESEQNTEKKTDPNHHSLND